MDRQLTGILITFVVASAILSPVIAILLRFSVSLQNRMFGADEEIELVFGPPPIENDIDYQTGGASTAGPKKKKAIPVPEFSRAIAITALQLLLAAISFVVAAMVLAAIHPVAPGLAVAVSLSIGVIIFSIIAVPVYCLAIPASLTESIALFLTHSALIAAFILGPIFFAFVA